MHSTGYPRVDDLLQRLLPQMQAALGANLVGLYLYGSVVSGDYDDALSDVDLLAALEHDLTEAELEALRVMHAGLVAALPHWDNRVEVAYLSRRALHTFRAERAAIGIISPGEPLHFREAGLDWLMNWYLVREGGLTLYGPPPQSIIPPISKAEFLWAVRDQTLAWRDYIHETSPHHGSQAYAILTMCRGLYTLEHEEYTSKIKAAAWAQTALPAWADLIRQALYWRQHMHQYTGIPQPPLSETARFVQFVTGRVAPLQTE
jgi:hypothetical protein